MSFKRYRLIRDATPEELEWIKTLGVKICNTSRFDSWYGHQLIDTNKLEFETLTSKQTTMLKLRFGSELVYIKEAEL